MTLSTKIIALSHDGRGITHIEGKTTFVSNALVDEEMLVTITKKHSRYLEAIPVTRVSSSPDRVEPHCQHFGLCGGCSLQHLSTHAQLAHKEKTLFEQLKHFGKVTPRTRLTPLTGTVWGYRRKARLGVRYVEKKGRVLVGFREKSSRYLADIDRCVTLHPMVGERIIALKNFLLTLEGYRHIAQIEVAIGDDHGALVIRHLEPLSSIDQTHWQNFGKQTGLQIYFQPNPPLPLKKLWPNDELDYLHYDLPTYQLTMRFHPLDFVQINAEINQIMIQQALSLLEPTTSDTILDLFCGLGNFTLPIAKQAKAVIGIEGHAEMVKRATENASLNQISNATFYAANLDQPSPNATWLQKTYDKILLDPARTGAQYIIPYFSQLGAKRIVYISCNPATLARDANVLVHQLGYTLKAAGIINMFPQTSHIEAITVFEAK